MISKLAALTAAAVLPATAIALDPSQGPGFIAYPLTQRDGSSLFGRHSKRQQSETVTKYKAGALYTIDITLGTPGQTVPAQFDTGSSELLINPVCSKGNNPQFCRSLPRFTASQTLVDIGVPGGVSYGTAYANFQYVHDFVTIGCKLLSYRDQWRKAIRYLAMRNGDAAGY